MKKLLRSVAVATVIVTACASAAQAAAVRSGATLQAIVALTRGTAVAYDSTNKVYLVVGSHGVLWGRFVRADGAPIGAPFAIQGNPANFAHFPRAAFSPDADNGTGGFLVTWHEVGPNAHGRMVSVAKNGAYGPDTQLTTDVTWWEAGAAVAYSTASHEFLVAWRALAGNDIHAVRVDNAATPKGPVFAVTNDVQYQDNPSIAYNPVTDEFMIVFAGFNDPGNFAFVDLQRVKAGGNTLLGGPVRLMQTGGTYITDVTYNSASNTFLAAWFALPGGAAFGRVIDANGTATSGIITLSTRWKAYDALSVGYNRRSDTFFMVSHGSTAEDGGVEIASGGTPVDNGFLVTGAGGNGNFYPRLAASTDDPNWLVSTAHDFGSTMVQLVAGTASSGAPTGPTAPATPVPNPIFSVDTPADNTTVSSTGFLISGWAVDTGAGTTGTGMDVVVCWAYPKNGGGAILAGIASYGHPRPDVGAWLGPNFAASGWGLLGVLPPGGYTLAIYAHSTVSNSWGTPKLLNATVTAPPSDPRMHVDLPAQNQDLTQNNVVVAGWALDRAAAAGPGVDTLHIWAYPATGAPPIFVGVAQYGDARPDVATAFGSSRFANAGFHLVGSLPLGKYTIVVFSHSAVTQTFNNAEAVAVTIR